MEAGRLEKTAVASEADTGVESSVKRAVDRTRDRNDGCYYTTVFNSVCSLHKDETGKPVQICEKTEKLLRRCPGRPQEIVESRTEKTVEDASTSTSGYLMDKDVRGNRSFRQPQWQDGFGLERGREREDSVLRDLFDKKGELYAGPIEELVQAAEDMVRDVFGPFGLAHEVPPRQSANGERPSGWFWGSLLGRDQNEKHSREEANSQHTQAQKPADYSGLARNIQEI